jgi:8-oxo-dGTP pyrophosphatase MutT (NUDIX family)
MSKQAPVRPRDAASLILLRDGKAGLEVLIGRRGKGARFMPGRYVFPGGRVTAEDARTWAGEPGGDKVPGFLALKHAALRETFEETGLVVGEKRAAPGEAKDVLSAVEEAYRRRGVAPAPALLRLADPFSCAFLCRRRSPCGGRARALRGARRSALASRRGRAARHHAERHALHAGLRRRGLARRAAGRAPALLASRPPLAGAPGREGALAGAAAPAQRHCPSSTKACGPL